MIAATRDVYRAEVAHAAEAVGIHDRHAAHRRVGNTRLWDLEEHAAERVVDLLVVLVLTLAEALEDRTESEILEQIGVAKRRREWDLEIDLVTVGLHNDLLCRESGELRVGVSAGGNARVELTVDHAVRPVAHDRELVREAWVHGRFVAVVRLQPDPERGQELRVGDVLDLRTDHSARDLEL